MPTLSICDVFQNMTFESTRELTVNEQSLLFTYLQFWNWKGRNNNNITPRNSFLRKQMGVSEHTYYKARTGLKDKGFIVVATQKFNKKGKQKPAIIQLADWLVKSNKIAVDDQQQPQNQKTEEKTVPKVHETTTRPISVAELDQYGKDLAVQIGTTISVYPKRLERIKGYETETSKEVIKLVRSYVKSHNNSNAWAYYESTLEDLTRKHVKNLTDLEKYNPKLAGKTRYDQQQLPLLAVVGEKKNNTSKKTYKPRYAYKKRVEQGVDWTKKKAHIYTDAENDEHTREMLGLTPSQEWPEEYANLSPNERYSKALKASFKQLEEEYGMA